MPRRVVLLVVAALVAAAAAFVMSDEDRRGATRSVLWKTALTAPDVARRLEEIGDPARARWSPHFAAAGVAYPPDTVVLCGLKEERRLDVYASKAGGRATFVRSIPVRGASGGPGPKLKEGDRQVPEGVYAAELLNPASIRHVSVRVGYPNADDRARAAEEGRTNLGGDIMIHGGSDSIGCLAIGDEAAEDVFTLVADVGLERTEIVIAPRDLRTRDDPTVPPAAPRWTAERWAEIRARLQSLAR